MSEASKAAASSILFGIFCPGIYGDMEILRDSETGAPDTYASLAAAAKECAELNQDTDGGYYVMPCDSEGRESFYVTETGGGCQAFARDLPDGCQVLVSDGHCGLDFDDDNWCVTKHDPTTGDEVQAHWRDASDNYEPTHGAKTIEAALAACGVTL